MVNTQVHKLVNKRALSDLKTALREIKDKKTIRLHKNQGTRHY